MSMTQRILSVNQAANISKTLREQGKKVVLTGGCFDLLHIGHITLLEKAKAAGDVLFVLLEADKRIAQLKGLNRPIKTQEERAVILSALRFVDYVVCLPNIASNDDYDTVLTAIKPAIIAVTEGDKGIEHKNRQATKIGAIVSEVVEYIPNRSTSAILKSLLEEK